MFLQPTASGSRRSVTGPFRSPQQQQPLLLLQQGLLLLMMMMMTMMTSSANGQHTSSSGGRPGLHPGKDPVSSDNRAHRSSAAYHRQGQQSTTTTEEIGRMTQLVEQILAGNDAMMSQMRKLAVQQQDQREQIERMNAQRDAELQQHRESVAERQQLKLMISNLTRELTSVEDAVASTTTTTGQQGGQQQQQQQQHTMMAMMRQRVRRELQALACNVTAELQTVITIGETSDVRLQRIEANQDELNRRLLRLTDQVTTALERFTITNVTAAVESQLQQQQIRDRARFDGLVDIIRTELARAGGVGRPGTPGGHQDSAAGNHTNTSMTEGTRTSWNQNLRLVSSQLNVTLPTGPCVWGVTEFNNRLYVARSSRRALEVHDLASLVEPLLDRDDDDAAVVNGLGCFNDLTSSPGCDAMYVVDNCNRLVHVVDSHGVRVQWPTEPEAGTPLAVSMTYECGALVTYENTSRVSEYAPDGRLLRGFSIQSAAAATASLSRRPIVPTHAVKLADNRYIVSHGNPGDAGLHRVCLVDETGAILRSYGGERGSDIGKLNVPARLALVNAQLLLVLDSHNDRVVLLNAESLVHVREVILLPTRAEFLVRLSLGHISGANESRLYLGHNDFTGGKCQQGNVKVVNLSWLTQ